MLLTGSSGTVQSGIPALNCKAAMRHLLRTPIPALSIALMLCLLAVGCVLTQREQVPQAEASEPSTPVRVEPSAPVVPRPDHVVVVVMENKHRSSVIGSSEAPFINRLAGLGANMSASYGVTHPSQPNYIALFSGSQQGITTNACRTISGADNLGRQLLDRGLTFAGYAESMPSAGYTGCTQGNYHRKHNPWVSFDNLPKSVNQPFTAFPSNYARLPTVAFVTPNMCNDMHNCSIRTGDDWLRKNSAGTRPGPGVTTACWSSPSTRTPAAPSIRSRRSSSARRCDRVPRPSR